LVVGSSSSKTGVVQNIPSASFTLCFIPLEKVCKGL
jgi:hypothetical protein